MRIFFFFFNGSFNSNGFSSSKKIFMKIKKSLIGFSRQKNEKNIRVWVGGGGEFRKSEGSWGGRGRWCRRECAERIKVLRGLWFVLRRWIGRTFVRLSVVLLRLCSLFQDIDGAVGTTSNFDNILRVRKPDASLLDCKRHPLQLKRLYLWEFSENDCRRLPKLFFGVKRKENVLCTNNVVE